jgi:hypothetical protein
VTNLVLRAADSRELHAVLTFWKTAAENDSRPPDTPAALAALHLRDPEALIVAVERDRIRSLGGTRIDAMVLDDNPRAHAIWAARGYHRQQDWSRWVKPL